MDNPLPSIDPEFKTLIPPLSQEEYSQLEQNILSNNKCRDAIITWNGIIVDGHNRFNICVTHGISFEIKEMDFDSRNHAKLWILENQLGRRNLTDAQRIELALLKTELLKEKARKNQIRAGREKTRADKLFSKSSKPDDVPVNVHKAAAQIAGVSDGTIHNYLQLSKHDNPELLNNIKTNNLKINTAHRLLPTEIQKQLNRANKQYRYIKSRFPLKNDDAANQEIKAQLVDLHKHLEMLRRAGNA